MRIDNKVVRLTADRHVVDGQHLLPDLLETLGIGIEDHAGARIDQHPPAAIVELEIAAACGVHIRNDLAVARGEVIHQLLHGGVEPLCILHRKRHDHLLQKLRGRGDGQLGDGVLVLKRLDKSEVFNKGMLVHAHLSCEIGVVKHRGLALKRKSGLGRRVADAVEAPHKIEVPGRAAELTIGDDVVTRRFLLGDEIADGVVLHGLERRGVDPAALKVGARLLECRGAQEAADVVVTERSVGLIHALAPLQLKFALIIRRRIGQVKWVLTDIRRHPMQNSSLAYRALLGCSTFQQPIE